MPPTSSAPAAAAAADGTPPTRQRSPWVTLVGLTAGLGVILVVLLGLFIFPSLKSGPSDLPIGLVGDAAAVAQVDAALAEAAPGAYETREVAGVDELRTAIEDRELVAGLVVAPGAIDAYVASAGSTAISGTVTATAEALAGATGATATVVDVVPLPDADPTGIGIGGLAFPLVFGGIVPAVAFRKLAPSLRWAVAGILTFSAVAGVIVSAVLMFVFGSITTGFWPVAGALALGTAALALPLAGLQEAFGGKGFTIGAMIMMFLGNPLAGIATTAAWLPAGIGAIGQLLPPGAAGTLVRSAAYFDGAGGVGAAFTLAAWVAAGAVLLVVGARRNRAATTVKA